MTFSLKDAICPLLDLELSRFSDVRSRYDYPNRYHLKIISIKFFKLNYAARDTETAETIMVSHKSGMVRKLLQIQVYIQEDSEVHQYGRCGGESAVGKAV